ncbi:ornithine carbamoyltransferase [Planctomycetota bacterium]
MPNSLRGRDLTGMFDLNRHELTEVLELALELKRRARANIFDKPLAGNTLGLLFQKPSLRTRVSFEVAMGQLGGKVLYLSRDEVGMGLREEVPDVAMVLSRYFDVIAARVFEHRIVVELAKHAEIPVINALSDGEHPCQILADLLTILERRGRLKGLKVAYVGDGNNVAVSLGLGCALMGMHFFCATPSGYELPREAVDRMNERNAKRQGTLHELNDPKEAARGAHVIYTDVWTSMGQEAEREQRTKDFAGFTVDDDLLALGDDPMVLHCLPAHYGEEISREVGRGPRSAIWDQSENRLHAQKALLALVV